MNSREITFDGHTVLIEFEKDEVDPLLDFLFGDLEKQEKFEVQAVFRVNFRSAESQWELTRNQCEMFNGKNLNDLGNVLAGEVLFSLIENNHTGMAIHAGLVSNDRGCMLLPADSGSGKSSVTTWLLTQGWHYHTDELVIIDLKGGHLRAFTRPLNIKTGGIEPISKIFDIASHRSELRSCDMATMIPHRLINPDYISDIPQLGAIVFPHYTANSQPGIQRISGAEAGLELMRSNVIARNLPGHGFRSVTQLVRSIPGYRLHYQHFDDLWDCFAKVAF
ncbi:MAG: hypothetical protein WBM41_08015 [Arenicellales bacterium]